MGKSFKDRPFIPRGGFCEDKTNPNLKLKLGQNHGTVACRRLGHALSARSAGRQSRSAILSTSVRDARGAVSGSTRAPRVVFRASRKTRGAPERSSVPAVSRATAERGARSATPGGGCAPRTGRQSRSATLSTKRALPQGDPP
jgi:hypothetical protein